MGVEAAAVAGAVPAARLEHLGPVPPEQAQHQRVAPDPDLPGLARGQLGAGAGVDDAVLDAGHAAPERALLALGQLHVERLDRVRSQRLGHSQRGCPPGGVAHPEMGGQEVVEAAAPDRRKVAPGEGRMLDQGLGRVGPADHVGRPAPLDQIQGGARLEPLLEQHRGAGVHGADQRVGQAPDPEQRHGRVQHVAGGQVPELQQVERVDDHRGVGVDHALGLGGAARGVDHDHRILRLDCAGRGVELFVRYPLGPAQQVVDGPGPSPR